MVRSVSHFEDEENHDSSSPTDSRRVERKVNPSRSKHSETEQRRRSKINERFQILRDLIPENDQKRDKASFLLEVIQYIQFLQEKLQIYEGSGPGWSTEPAKCLPLVDNVPHPTLLSDAQNSVAPDLTGAILFKSTDNPPVATEDHLNMPMQAPLFESVSGQPHQGSSPDAEQLIQQSQPNFWPWRSCEDDYSDPIYTTNQEEMKSERGEASISNVCSQEVLNSLANALQSSGVDISQANISVQLDIGKRTNGGSTTTMFFVKDQEDASDLDYRASINMSENYEHPQKRFRADHT